MNAIRRLRMSVACPRSVRRTVNVSNVPMMNAWRAVWNSDTTATVPSDTGSNLLSPSCLSSDPAAIPAMTTNTFTTWAMPKITPRVIRVHPSTNVSSISVYVRFALPGRVFSSSRLSPQWTQNVASSGSCPRQCGQSFSPLPWTVYGLASSSSWLPWMSGRPAPSSPTNSGRVSRGSARGRTTGLAGGSSSLAFFFRGRSVTGLGGVGGDLGATFLGEGGAGSSSGGAADRWSAGTSA